MKNIIILIFLLLGSCTLLNGQIINGDITFKQIGVLEIEIEVNIYYSSGNYNISNLYGRDSIFIDWGDNTTSLIERVNGSDADNNGTPDGELISNLFSTNIYRAIHEYNSYGEFVIAHQLANRPGGIVNVNFPNSENVPFYIKAEVNIIESYLNNNSPKFLEPPIDFAYVNQPFIQYINAFDIDDDSVSYHLVTPLAFNNQEVPGYTSPQDIGQDTVSNNFTLDSSTGRLEWVNPPMFGQFVIAYEVISYRNGQAFDKVMRDMSIFILSENDISPEIDIDTSIHSFQFVQVGDTINFNVQSIDQELGQTINLTSSCGLYSFFTEQATFETTVISQNEIQGTFNWIVKPEHIRTNSFQAVFKSKDDYSNLGFATYKMVRFKVEEDILDVINNNSLDLKVNLFPNPSKDFISVWISELKSNLSFQLRSSNGELVNFGILNGNKYELSISNLPTGNYFLILMDDQGNSLTRSIFKL